MQCFEIKSESALKLAWAGGGLGWGPKGVRGVVEARAITSGGA